MKLEDINIVIVETTNKCGI